MKIWRVGTRNFASKNKRKVTQTPRKQSGSNDKDQSEESVKVEMQKKKLISQKIEDLRKVAFDVKKHMASTTVKSQEKLKIIDLAEKPGKYNDHFIEPVFEFMPFPFRDQIMF